MTFHLDTYLERIGLNQPPHGAKGLHQLQFAQICAIPFENVYPFLGRVPFLDEDRIWQKLVVDRCGGYCFELNALLGLALQALGYSSQQVLARVRMGEPEGGAKTHLAHVVTLEGTEWLVDAGFGGQAPAEPVNMSTKEEQQIRNQIYRIRFDASENEQVLERKSGGGWVGLFGFDRSPFKPVDIDAANFLCAKWPEISFSSSMKFYRHTSAGWISFQNGLAGFTTNGAKTSRTIRERNELAQFMREEMGLGYGDAEIDAIAERLASLPPVSGR